MSSQENSADQNTFPPANTEETEQPTGLANEGSIPLVTGEFGLPVDPEEISARNSDEFEATGEVTRTVAALDLGPEKLSPGLDTSLLEFETTRGGFTVSAGLFASSDVAAKELVVAPPMVMMFGPTSRRSSLTQPFEFLAILYSACAHFILLRFRPLKLDEGS
jgi:hypothetical protein